MEAWKRPASKETTKDNALVLKRKLDKGAASREIESKADGFSGKRQENLETKVVEDFRQNRSQRAGLKTADCGQRLAEMIQTHGTVKGPAGGLWIVRNVGVVSLREVTSVLVLEQKQKKNLDLNRISGSF